jgi:carboxylesterase
MTDRTFTLEGENGKGALLIHGLTGAPGEMQFLARRLHRRGFTVHVPQLAGHGLGLRELLATSWSDWLDSVREAYEKLARRVDETHVAGICAGGALGLALAAEQPALKRAAVYSMTFSYDGWNMKAWYRLAPLLRIANLVPLLRAVKFPERHPYGLKDERLREQLERAPDALIDGALSYMPLGALNQMYSLCRHVERAARRVMQPTLIAHAREDDMSHLRNAHRLAGALAGPVRMLVLEDSFHMIHVDRERKRVADETARFFGGESSRSDEESP